MRETVWLGGVLIMALSAPAARAQGWGQAEARTLCQAAAQGQRNTAQVIGDAALRLLIHPHTPNQTPSVNPRVDPDGGDLVFNFTIDWTTQLGNTYRTVLVSRINQEGVKSCSVSSDNSSKAGNEANVTKVRDFLRDALWGALNGWSQRTVKMPAMQTVQNHIGGLFNAGFGKAPYAGGAFAFLGRDAEGNTLITIVGFWERGLTGKNQTTVLRWRINGNGHVGVQTESTSDPTNATNLENYLRDTLLPQARGLR